MKPSQTRAQKWTRVIYTLVLLSFILPVGYLIYRLIFWDEAAAQALERTRADYALMLLQCLLGIVVIHLPTFLTRRFRFELPAALYIMYILFLYGAIFLGEVRSFYYMVPHWDVFLHAFSSLMAGSFGFMVVALLNRNERVPIHLSPFFVALFAFCFAVTIGATWLLSAPRYLVSFYPISKALAVTVRSGKGRCFIVLLCLILSRLYLCAFVLRWQVW